MKTIKQKILVATVLVFSAVSVFAQPIFPGDGGTNNYYYTNNFIYTPSPYVPGLKLAIPPLIGTNLFINLLEADPAGTYDIFAASNLVGAVWNDVLQGTNGQTNFTLPFPFTAAGFFRAARTDPAIDDAGNLSFYFLNGSANTNIVQAAVQGGPAAAAAILVDSTNFAEAVWIPFTSMPLVDIGTNEGIHEVWFGFKGTNGIAYWAMDTITIDTTPPLIVITNPVFSTTAKPIIQVQGYSSKPLAGIYFDVTNAAGVFTNQQGFVTSQFFDTNTFAATTNYFQCFDIPLTNGANMVIIYAMDMAGNVTTTNVAITLDFSGDTNPPVAQVIWPQDGDSIGGDTFTLRGVLDDETAQVFAQTVDTNGVTNNVEGIVERNGKFWLEDLPLNPGTNDVTIMAIDAAGNSVITNLTLIQSDVAITIDEVADDQLNLSTTTMTGNVSDPSYDVWVNGIEATVGGSGNWNANNVPVLGIGTACFDVTANPPSSQPVVQRLRANVSGDGLPSVKQSSTQDKPPIIYVNQYVDQWADVDGEINFTESLGATKNYTATVDEAGKLSFRGNGSFYYHVGEGYGLWDTTYQWSDTNQTGAFTTLGYDANGDPVNVNGAGNGDDFVPDLFSAPSMSWVDNYREKLMNFYANINYGWSWPDYYGQFQNFSRSSRTYMKIMTGGKNEVTRKNLFSINGAATKYGQPASSISCPGPQGDVWPSDTPRTIIDPTQIRILGKNVGNDGNLYTVLPDNATLDLVASAPGRHYSLNASAQKYKLRILANGYPLADDRVRPQAYYCVGQKLNFQAVLLPDVSGLNYMSPTWNYTADYVNNHWTDANGCEEYNIAAIPAMSNPTTAWFYNKQTQDATANLGLYCKFNNGQSVYLVQQGKFNVFTPSISISTSDPNGPPVVHIDRVWEQPTIRIGITDTNNSSHAYDLMAFYGYVNSTTNFPGEVIATQLINRDASIDGIPFDSTGGSYCLDTSETYPDSHDDLSINGSHTYCVGTIDYADGPGVGILEALWGASINDHFKTYCRFRPSGDGNIYVTLKRVDWDWNATVQYAGSNPFSLSSWTITSSGIGGPTPVDVNEFPLWDCGP